MIDYETYRFSKRERLRYLLSGLLLIACISFLFYRSVFAFALGLLLFYPYLKAKKKECIKRRRESLTLQFRDCILAFANALTVGYSIENAWRETYQDLGLLYREDADIMTELSAMIRQMDNQVALETLLLDFAERSRAPDIMDFAEIFAVAKRSGGNLAQIIQKSADAISDKLEVKREIQVSLTSRRYEQRIMNAIPVAMIAYINVSSPHYFDVLYHNVAGIAIMSVCLLMYLASILLSQKIMQAIFARLW
ncbi:MAG: hypothetical protein J6P60_01175 [Lachnospiraceae bacterium]|nr:hypothetical protein [Lachnospiraceae bacterium]